MIYNRKWGNVDFAQKETHLHYDFMLQVNVLHKTLPHRLKESTLFKICRYKNFFISRFNLREDITSRMQYMVDVNKLDSLFWVKYKFKYQTNVIFNLK